MNISLVIPLLNEEKSLPELTEWIVKVMQQHNFSYEIIYVDDGSTDKSWNVIEELSSTNSNVKGIKFRRNYGKSAGLNRGFDVAQGDVVITMDADLQDSPDEIPELYKMIVEEDYDIVSGWKKKRYDPLSKTIPTKLYNFVTRRMHGVYLHDMKCGLKAYKNEVIKTIEIYGEMHRYIPVIAKWKGFAKIGEKVVQHQSRKYGESKFGFERFINGFLDLLSITFISKFGRKPMHFFGLMGTLMFILGFFLTVYLGAKKIYCVYMNIPQKLITSSPYFYLSLVVMIIGVQLFLAGFLSEMISRNSPVRNQYVIEKKLGLTE